jgi:hypothetical protein
MNCREFQEVLPEIVDGGQTLEQEMHWKSCMECSNLVADLTLISQEARTLRAAETPSPRVWNSIEIALRQEGLIHQGSGLAVVPSAARRWSMGWLVPIAAGLLLSFAAADYYMASKQQVQSPTMATMQAPSSANDAVDADDTQLLEVVSSATPAMRATYESNLRDVNAYIRDAEDTVQQNPGDEDAQQLLMDAYAQKNMIYEMAMDRSLR